MSHPRIEVHSLDTLETAIGQVQARLVTFDECPLADKSTACIQVRERLGAIGLELDHYVVREQGEYVKALRTVDLSRALHEALPRSSVVFLNGVYMREILAILRVTARLHVYPQPISQSGTLRNIEIHHSLST